MPRKSPRPLCPTCGRPATIAWLASRKIDVPTGRSFDSLSVTDVLAACHRHGPPASYPYSCRLPSQRGEVERYLRGDVEANAPIPAALAGRLPVSR